MKKSIPVIVLLSFFFAIVFLFVPPKNVQAYAGGIMAGTSAYRGNCLLCGNTTSAVTDGNEVTSATFATTTFNTFSSVFQNANLYTITSVTVNSNAPLLFKLYNSSQTVIYTANLSASHVSGGYTFSVPTVTGAYAWSVYYNSGGTLYEIDFNGIVTTPVPTPTPTPDITPPENVSGLSNGVTYTSSTLNFTTPSTSDFSRYKIYQNGTLIYTSVNGTTKNSPMSYTASPLSSSTTYSFKVTTVDTTGNESAGVTTSATTLTPDTTPPANVSGLTAFNIAYTSATLEFTTPSDSDFSKYKIYQNGTLIFTSIPGVQKNYLTPYYLTALNASTTYLYKVTTIDATGNESIGVTKSVTTLTPDLTPPAIPSNLVITGANGSANFTWNAVSDSDLKGYFLYKDGSRIFTTPITATNFNLNGLVTGQNYYYTISSIDLADNESAQSVVYTYISLDTIPPAVPFGLNVIVSDQSISMGWNAVSNTDLAGYYVYQDGVKISAMVTNNIYTVDGLINMHTYDFKVSSVDLTGNESLLSSAIQAMPIPAPDTTPPAIPSNLVLSPLDEQIQITWAKVLDLDLLGYFVYRDGVKLNNTPLNYNKYIDNSVTNNVYYSYQISGIDNSGNESMKSVSSSVAPIPSNVPKVHVNFSLSDLIAGIENWFSSIWLLLAFCIAIPLAFYIANRVKALY